MKHYEKPIILANEEIAEGIYTASGSNCYTVSASITQTPQTGRGDYRLQVNAKHAAANSHQGSEQILTINFNQAVTYSWGGTLISGNGTSTLRIKYNYHQNGNDNIGLNDLVVVSDSGLAVTGAVMQCNGN
jgi:acyl dehydratase